VNAVVDKVVDKKIPRSDRSAGVFLFPFGFGMTVHQGALILGYELTILTKHNEVVSVARHQYSSKHSIPPNP
jgi:hypothetical protein